MSRGDGYRGERGIKADVRHGSTNVGVVGEVRPIIHDRGVATAHPRVRIDFEGLAERSGDTDRCGRLGGEVGSLREKLGLCGIHGVHKVFVGLRGGGETR